MELTVKKVLDRVEAVCAIESQQYKVVQLDYEDGPNDVFELGRLGRKFGVGVQFISQIAVIAKNERSLEEKLTSPKGTFKQRFVQLDFDVDDSTLGKYQSMASKQGDIVLPKGFDLFSSEIWE